MNPLEVTFTVVVAEDKEGGFISRLEQIPFVFGYGKTELEAVESAANSFRVYISHRINEGSSTVTLKSPSSVDRTSPRNLGSLEPHKKQVSLAFS